MIGLLSRTGRARRHHRDLVSQFDPLLKLVDDADALAKRVDAVSAWSVGEHLEHVARVDEGIYDGIERLLAESSVGEGGPTRIGRVLLLLGFIPRGRGKSPKPFVATGVPADEVRSMLEVRREIWRAFEPRLDDLVRSRARSPHPSLGPFDAAQWLRFALIHAQHHERIIDEINRAEGSRQSSRRSSEKS